MSEENKQQEWAERLKAQQASGQSAAAFCREHGLTEWAFSYWKRKLRKQSGTEVSVASRPSGRFSRVEFVQPPSLAGVTIRFPAGVALESSVGYPDPAWICAVVSGLGTTRS